MFNVYIYALWSVSDRSTVTSASPFEVRYPLGGWALCDGRKNVLRRQRYEWYTLKSLYISPRPKSSPGCFRRIVSSHWRRQDDIHLHFSEICNDLLIWQHGSRHVGFEWGRRTPIIFTPLWWRVDGALSWVTCLFYASFWQLFVSAMFNVTWHKN